MSNNFNVNKIQHKKLTEEKKYMISNLMIATQKNHNKKLMFVGF